MAVDFASGKLDSGMVVATSVVQVFGHESEVGRQEVTPGTLLNTDINVGVLFERLLDAVVIARLSTGRIVMWNSAAEKLFGYTSAEVVGKPIEILMSEPIANLHRGGVERYLRTGHGLLIDTGAPVDLPARTKSGEEIRVELSLSELQNGAGERFAVAVIRDAMHRKQLELINLELTQAKVGRAEAETAVADRDELIGAIETTLERDPVPAGLHRLVGALAILRRLRSGEMKIRPVDGDLVDVVHAASDAARRRAGQRRLLVHTPPSAPASFDPAALRQVLDCVLDEAISSSTEAAPIHIRVELISTQLVQLSVRSDASNDGRAAGVGLLVSRLIVQHQGGTFTTALSSSGSLEVILTLPGSPHPLRRRSSRARKPAGRATSVL